MISSDLTDLLRKNLSSNYIVVLNPDHPYLYTMPDILLGGEGKLISIYIPKKNEVINPTNLLARYLITRLGLPQNNLNLIVLPNYAKDLSADVLKKFQEIIPINSSMEIIRFIKRSEAGYNVEPLPHEILNLCHQRYQLVYNFTKRQIKKEGFGRRIDINFSYLEKEFKRPKPYIYYEHRFQKTKKRKIFGPKHLIEYENIFVGAPSAKGKKSTIGSIKSFLNFSVLSEHDQIYDISYPNYRTGHLLIINELPVSRPDPEKLIRAASFVGWAFAAPESHAELLEIADHLREEWQKAKYE